MPSRSAPIVLASALTVAGLVVLGSGLTTGCRSDANQASLGAKVAPGRTAAAPSRGTEAKPATVRPIEPEAAAEGPSLSGTLEPRQRATLMPRVGGQVTRVHVQEGDLVKAGAPLVSIDPEQFRLMQQLAEAAVAGAKVGLETTRLQWDRLKALLDENVVPRSQFEVVDAQYRGAQVQVQAAEAQLALATWNHENATVRAPFRGLVIHRHVSVGSNAAAMPPTPLITMEDTTTLDLRVQVPAANLEDVSAGDTARVYFPSTGSRIAAKITRIVPSINAGTRTFSAIMELDNEAGELRPGMFAEVRLGARTRPQGITVAPAAAPSSGVRGAGR